MRRARGRMTIVVGVLGWTLFATGCAVPIRTGATLQSGHDLGEYISFTWGEPDDRPTGDPRLDDNPLFQQRVHAAIEWELSTRGIALARDGRGEAEMGLPGKLFRVHHHTNIEDHVELYGEDVNAAFMAEYGEETQVVQTEEATFIVGLADADTGQLVWSGWAVLNFEKALANSAVMQGQVDAAVAAMFERFPVPIGGAAPTGPR